MDSQYSATYERMQNAKNNRSRLRKVDLKSVEYLESLPDGHLAGIAMGCDVYGREPVAEKVWKQRKGNMSPKEFVAHREKEHFQRALKKQSEETEYARLNHRKYKKYKRSILRCARRMVGFRIDWDQLGILEQDVRSHFRSGISPEVLAGYGEHFYDFDG